MFCFISINSDLVDTDDSSQSDEHTTGKTISTIKRKKRVEPVAKTTKGNNQKKGKKVTKKAEYMKKPSQCITRDCENGVYVRTWCSSCRQNHYLCWYCWNEKGNYKNKCKPKEFMCVASRNVCFDCGKMHKYTAKDAFFADHCIYHPYIWCIRNGSCGNHNVCGVCEDQLLKRYEGTIIDDKTIDSYHVYQYFDDEHNFVCDLDRIKEIDKKKKKPCLKKGQHQNMGEKKLLPSPKFYHHRNKTKKPSKKKAKITLSAPTRNSRYDRRCEDLFKCKQVC